MGAPGVSADAVGTRVGTCARWCEREALHPNNRALGPLASHSIPQRPLSLSCVLVWSDSRGSAVSSGAVTGTIVSQGAQALAHSRCSRNAYGLNGGL